MLTTAKICALLLSGAVIGAASVTVTQRVTQPAAIKHPAKKIAQPRPLHKAKPVPFYSAPSNKKDGPSLIDCPAPAPSLGPGVWAPVPALAPPLSAEGPPSWLGGGGTAFPPSVVSPPTPSPPVPEPGAWALLIAGFGLVAVSLRRRKHEDA